MTLEMAALEERLSAARVQLQEEMRRFVPGGDVDQHQVAASELAWATARMEAATAAADWAAQCQDPLALEVARAAADDALSFLEGAALPERVVRAELLQRIAQGSRPMEDLGATAERKLVRETFRAFASREIRPHAGAIHREDLDVPETIIRGLAELGVFGLSVPSEYGGARGGREDLETMLVVTEELSKAALGPGGSLGTRPEILVRAILSGGTEEQKRRWLPAIASGEKMVAVAATEPDFGSDVAGITCRATRTESGWRVDGTKLWCTFAGRAELLMLLLRTSDAGHKGLSVFVAEKPAERGRSFSHRQPGGGLLEGRAIPTLGYRGMHSFELRFSGYELPPEALLGGEAGLGRGFYLQMEGFAVGRLQTAARAVGVAQAALEEALRYAAQRVVFGRVLAEQGLAQAALGRMIVEISAARQLSYRAARLMEAGRGQMEASLAKLYASRVAELVTREAMQLHGGIGYGEETEVSRLFADARVLSIFEGAEEVLALRVIARKLLTPG